MEPTVEVRDAEGARWITLRRPPVNALGLAEYDALAAAFTFGDDDPEVRVVVLRGEGRAFSAGQDLHDLRSWSEPGEVARYLRRAVQGVAAAARCPVPVLCALDGSAVGAGALLVASSDIVLGTRDATLALPELRVGLRLGRTLMEGVLPDQVLSHAFTTGAHLDAVRLHGLGILAELVDGADLAARVDAVLADLLALPDESLTWLRRPGHRAELADAYLAEVEAALGGA